MPYERPVTVVGAGLAGAEAAYQLGGRGVPVRLIDMKPHKKTPAHQSDDFGELVCSNSLRSDRTQNAAGLLKEELRRFRSLVMRAADATRVPAGGALAVDRAGFSAYITEAIKNEPRIEVIGEEVTALPDAPAVIATGPLTAGALFEDIESNIAPGLHFYDAAAPIIVKESIDMGVAFYASRYGRGEDYINCPMTETEYRAFYMALIAAKPAKLHGFETPRVFEGCMPVEVMAKRGEQTLAFGPLKPVGLTDPRTGGRPYAVVQLRQDDANGVLYNMVGFQTNLTFPEQRRVFRMIPGLSGAAFARYGVMHRNTFLPSPGILGMDYSVKRMPGLFFAGQITGVEGYVESAASGFVAAIGMHRFLNGLPPLDFTRKTATGALARYVSEYAGGDFQPMNINYGIMEGLDGPFLNKARRYEAMAARALAIVAELQKIC
ncbi:MAG: methylenetetrahydrofolate--tRNA-(uracil(54)-C(5))-methyltransferase (FADH(2)-oxidizing) TrmFO [Clostridiales bacterium]|jgi:methylenetetrahydrofolate--tRNA-(uracil-5-)-methyltransferase|nr:methylenetetrahydrofolate--tRNA-(uracil(54)-C(5))-methyltransferase (FADH(2)-oxidizing) TrmFO [Clostridiales bacterium]